MLMHHVISAGMTVIIHHNCICTCTTTVHVYLWVQQFIAFIVPHVQNNYTCLHQLYMCLHICVLVLIIDYFMN